MADAPKEVMVRLVAVIVPLNILVLGILFASMRTSSSDQGLDSDEKNQSNLMKSDSRPQAKSSSQDDDINSMMDVDVKGTKALELCRAIDVNLENATKVIGIKIAGQARAYVVDAFHAKNVREAKDLAVHVVYDSMCRSAICICPFSNNSESQINTLVTAMAFLRGWYEQ
jgi:hypothetical protein